MLDAIEFISDSVVEYTDKLQACSCDLFVVVDPDQATLEAAFSILKPGGNLYVEWTVAPWFKSTVIKKRLKQIGFEEVFLYLPKPDPSKSIPTMWIPLEVPGAIEFLTNSKTGISTMKFFKRVGNFFRRFLWRSYPKLILSYPWLISSGLNKFSICSVCSKPEMTVRINRVEEKSIKILKDYLNSLNKPDNTPVEDWKDCNCLSDQQIRYSALMLAGDMNRANKIVLLIYYGLNQDPSFVVKISRNEESASILNEETNVLKTISFKYKNISGVPKILFSNQSRGIHMNVQTFISGVPLSSVMRKHNYREFAKLATDWLVNFAANSTIVLPENWRDKMVHSVLAELKSLMGTNIESNFIDQTINHLNSFDIPYLVCEHRDFGPQNIHVDSNNNLGIIDWEFCRLYGIPALDLIFFLTRASIILEGAPKKISYSDCYRQMLDCNTFTGRIYQDCMNNYISSLDIPSSQIPSLRLFTWIVHYYWRMYGDEKHSTETQIQEYDINHWTLTLWKEELSIS